MKWDDLKGKTIQGINVSRPDAESPSWVTLSFTDGTEAELSTEVISDCECCGPMSGLRLDVTVMPQPPAPRRARTLDDWLAMYPDNHALAEIHFNLDNVYRD